jgi:uncharacterized protein (DUF58 family)
LLTEAVLFVILLLMTAALVKGGFAFTILYLFLGTYVASLVWTRQSMKNIQCERHFEKRVFWGEEIRVRLEISNRGRLPIPWLYLYESLPVELTSGKIIRRLVSLGPRGKAVIPYSLVTHKRGYFSLGPLVAKFGDTLGLVPIQELDKPPDYITVYPRIISINELKLPSQSPLGTLRHHQPIFEDPTRARGKREYVAGDSLRSVDWKATAATDQLQVKQYEPSIALQTAIFLNLNLQEYITKHRVDSTELAIVIAASLANWIVAQKQSVGLVTNGLDAHADHRPVQPIHPRKGRSQLIRILEMLARLQAAEVRPLAEMLRDETPRLPWGTTAVLITGQFNDALFDELFQMRRRGQSVVLVIAGLAANIQKARQQGKQFGFPVYAFSSEQGLETWRKR